MCRLIRVQAKGQTKHDVWLLTNVLSPQRLPAKTAAKFYRWRWRNEGLFRTYKRTLKKVKLASRTVRLIHRELEGSLLALQILLAHADLALRPEGTIGELAVSPRKVLIEIRQEIAGSATLTVGRPLTAAGWKRAASRRAVSAVPRRVVNGHVVRPTDLPGPRFSSR